VTRSRLLDAAALAFADRGFDEVTVDDLCAAAGIAKGTFYFHFPSKEALLVALFFRGTHARVDEVDRWVAAGLPFHEGVDRVVRSTARRTAQFPRPLVARAVREVLAVVDRAPGRREDGSRAGRALEILVIAGQNRGEVTNEFRADEIAMALNWAVLQGLLVWGVLDRDRPTLVAMLRRRVRMLMRGIAVVAEGEGQDSDRPAVS